MNYSSKDLSNNKIHNEHTMIKVNILMILIKEMNIKAKGIIKGFNLFSNSRVYLRCLYWLVAKTSDGKVTTYHESVESIDEANRRITYKVFGEDFDDKFKVFKVIFEATPKDEGGDIIKWIIEYETTSEEVDPPFAFLEFVHKGSRDVDANLLKA